MLRLSYLLTDNRLRKTETCYIILVPLSSWCMGEKRCASHREPIYSITFAWNSAYQSLSQTLTTPMCRDSDGCSHDLLRNAEPVVPGIGYVNDCSFICTLRNEVALPSQQSDLLRGDTAER